MAMKKAFRILLIVLGSLLLLLIIIPIIFQGKIETVVKQKINESVYAWSNQSRYAANVCSEMY